MEQFEIEVDFTSGKPKQRKNSHRRRLLFSLVLFGIILCFGLFLYNNSLKINIDSLVDSSPKKKYIVMIGDIGGTNVRLSLIKMSKDPNAPRDLIDRSTLKPQDFPSIEAVFESYLSKYKGTENYPLYGTIGVPGPVQNNVIYGLINIPHWKDMDGYKIEKEFGFKKFMFLNDFACNSYGIQTNLKLGEDYILINDVPGQEGGNKAIIGPGSGLGMGFLVKDKNNEYYTIGGSEGGHQDFTPKGEKYLKLREFTMKLIGNEVSLSVERLVSGQGLIPMYKFLLEQEPTIERDEELKKKIDEIDIKDKKKVNKINIELVNKGLNETCKLSRKVLELFIELYGEIAGDLSLVTVPSNGLYLVGGMSIVLQDLIKNTKIFMEHYINKDSYSSFLESFPIFLVKNGELGLLGAAECVRRFLPNEN